MALVKTLFVTRVYEAGLAAVGAEPLLEELKDACVMLASEDRAGRAWCRANGYPGYTSYASLDDLPTRASAFMMLKRRLDRHVGAFAEALYLDLGGRALTLDSLWVNVLDPKGAHSGHIHPKSVISGTLYIDCSRGAGALRLEDPRLPMMMAAPQLLGEAPEDQRRFVTLAPSVGVLYLWESWLRHEVLINKSRTRRISISFNYA
jgi:uncharacterized protein (TIGR02466 family)